MALLLFILHTSKKPKPNPMPGNKKTKNKISLTLRIISLCLIAQTLLSFPLWFRPKGILPYVPVFDVFVPFFQMSSVVLYPFFLGLLLLGSLYREKIKISRWILTIMLLLVLGNIHRLQVWFYFFGLIFFILSFYKKDKNEEAVLDTISILFAGVYIWGGIHKLNIYFGNDIFPWLVEPFFTIKSPAFGYLAAVGESLIGIGLLFPKIRKIALVGLILFHILILILLSPLGQNWNSVVLPWNLAMIALATTLFVNNNDFFLIRFYKNISTFIPAKLIWIPFLLPFLNYWQITPEQLSFKMYAGTHPEAIISFAKKDNTNIPALKNIKPVTTTAFSNRFDFLLDDLFFLEFNTPPFTTRYFTQRTAALLTRQLPNPQSVKIKYLIVNPFDEAKDQWEEWNVDIHVLGIQYSLPLPHESNTSSIRKSPNLVTKRKKGGL